MYQLIHLEIMELLEKPAYKEIADNYFIFPPVTPSNRFGNLNQQSIANIRDWTARKENLELGSLSKK